MQKSVFFGSFWPNPLKRYLFYNNFKIICRRTKPSTWLFKLRQKCSHHPISAQGVDDKWWCFPIRKVPEFTSRGWAKYFQWNTFFTSSQGGRLFFDGMLGGGIFFTLSIGGGIFFATCFPKKCLIYIIYFLNTNFFSTKIQFFCLTKSLFGHFFQPTFFFDQHFFSSIFFREASLVIVYPPWTEIS